MHIFICTDSEFYAAFDGHIFNYAPHRTSDLRGVGLWSHFGILKFFIHIIYQSMRSDLKSPNLKSELKYLNAISRNLCFCGDKFAFFGKIRITYRKTCFWPLRATKRSPIVLSFDMRVRISLFWRFVKKNQVKNAYTQRNWEKLARLRFGYTNPPKSKISSTNAPEVVQPPF